MRNIRNCNIDVPGGRWYYYDEEDAVHLPHRSDICQPISTASLTNISLNLVVVGYMSRFMEAGGNGAMQGFLSAAPNLVELELATDPLTERGFVDLENLLGNFIWQSLRRLRLKGMGVLQDQLVDLVLRHRSSLVLIELYFVGLTLRTEFLKAPITQHFGLPAWEEVLGHMEALDLEYLLIKSIWDSAYPHFQRNEKHYPSRSWSSNSREDIRKFLQAKGAKILPSLSVGF